ncbi:MAG: serine protease [Terrimonas sp.]|nr:serine protease [Terrimonas sp.]
MKKIFLGLFLLISGVSLANEGMWLPLLLEKLNEKEMRSLGMKISAKDIYSVNNGSLKDAILSFGGFCTGEVVSSQGLVLTNHHCGFDAIQNHSTLDHNYIKDGFWSRGTGEELPNPGLFVTFIVRIEDVTGPALKGMTAKMSESERQSLVDRNLALIRKNTKKEDYQDILVRPFFEGNQYYLFVTETYRDIRLVGAPPSSIGNFGKDTDNWMWPRHTGDFSMFRIYAGKDNRPADYSTENVPYKPKKSLSISLDGVAKNDFTMVFGFPGRTNEYLYSSAVKQVMEVNDPAKIAIRSKALNVIDGFMRKDEQLKIQYAAKWAGISNAWKKWQGEVMGLTRTRAVEKKIEYEKEFQKRVDANPVFRTKYGGLLGDMNTAYDELKPLGLARDYFTEIVSKIELFTLAGQLSSLVNAYEKEGEAGYTSRLPRVKERLEGLYGEYSALVDQKLFEALMEMYINDQAEAFRSTTATEQLYNYRGSFSKWAEAVYNESRLDDGVSMLDLLGKNPEEAVSNIKNDPGFILFNEMLHTYQVAVQGKLNEIQDRVNSLQRDYMAAQMEVFKEKKFYPDANSTLRVAYGNVKGYHAKDAVDYDIYTYLDGVIEKYIPGDYEFDLPPKMIELYKKKDFGPYGVKGRQPVCFIATNHTTGGNSGSPALDAWGNLVGLNFDRVWEGTMSDINYDPSICRNIMVDIRYVLFIIDKYAGAGHLVKEMKLVHPKKAVK